MKTIGTTATLLAAILTLGSFAGHAAPEAAPAAQAALPEVGLTIKGDKGTVQITSWDELFAPQNANLPIATVNDEVILLKDLTEAVETVHEGIGEEQTRKKQDLTEIINRLITSRLIIQEARNIGFDEEAQTQTLVDGYSRRLLRETLLRERVANLTPDPAAVEKRYQDLITTWKVRSLVFKKEDDAKKVAKQLTAGGNFAEVAAKAIADKTATGSNEVEPLKKAEQDPAINKILEKMKPGGVTSVIPLTTDYLILKFEGVERQENPLLKEKAREDVLSAARLKALEKYRDELVAKHAKIDKKLLKAIDYEVSTDKFEKLLTDKRVLAEVKGEKPVTVGDLGNAIREKFFHGVELAIKDKKVNKSKDELFTDLLARRVLEKEARLKKIDQRPDFKAKVMAYEDSTLFGTFVERVIKPEIKLTDEELDAYYKKHQDDFATPELLKLEAIPFKTSEAAQAGIEKLRQGMDFRWFSANAEGRAESDTPGLLVFNDLAVTTESLMPGIKKALTGVKPDDYRLYTDPGGVVYVIHVKDVILAGVQPYAEVSAQVRKAVYAERLNKSLEDWAGKLRAASQVTILATETR